MSQGSCFPSQLGLTGAKILKKTLSKRNKILVAFGIMGQRYSPSPFPLTGTKELQGEFADLILHHQPPNPCKSVWTQVQSLPWTCSGVYCSISWSTNSICRCFMARKKEIPEISSCHSWKKGSLGPHRNCCRCFFSQKERKKKCFHVLMSLERKKG